MKAVLFVAALVFGLQAQAACVDGSTQHTPILGDFGQEVGGYTSVCVNGKWQAAAQPACEDGDVSVEYSKKGNGQYDPVLAYRVVCQDGKWVGGYKNTKAPAAWTCTEGDISVEHEKKGNGTYEPVKAYGVVCHGNRWVRF